VTLEAQIYQAVARTDAFRHLQSVMQHILHFDPDSTTMPLALIKDAEDLDTRARRMGHNSLENVIQMGRIASR
jgi:hypothetical protein